MNNSVWTTDIQSLNDFEFLFFCRYFPILFDSCGHSLLNFSRNFAPSNSNFTVILQKKGRWVPP